MCPYAHAPYAHVPFVSAKYDELIIKTKEMNEQFKTNVNKQQQITKNLSDVEKKLDSNIKKNHRQLEIYQKRLG